MQTKQIMYGPQPNTIYIDSERSLPDYVFCIAIDVTENGYIDDNYKG